MKGHKDKKYDVMHGGVYASYDTLKLLTGKPTRLSCGTLMSTLSHVPMKKQSSTLSFENFNRMVHRTWSLRR